MSFWITKQDRKVQGEILAALLTITQLMTAKAPQPIKSTRPKVLTEDQLEDLAEKAAASNGSRLHYEEED